MEFSTDQLKAIESCTDLKRRVVGVSGPAGTGKTTIIKQAARTLRSFGRNVVLCAPTGRAARRIYEATGFDSRTVHKLLEYGKPEVNQATGEPIFKTGPARHKEKPIEFQDVFVDEYAMVNEELHRNLLDALPRGGRLLAFGDVAQLPPIEDYEIKTVDGAPFERILSLRSSVQLEVVYRQSEGSGLLENARRIRNGSAPIRKPDFGIAISEVPIKDLSDYVRAAIGSTGVDFSTVAAQVITPARRGVLGVHSLNTVLQNIFRPHQYDGLNLPREEWHKGKVTTIIHVGEKVICNENIYDLRNVQERFSRFHNDGRPDWSSFIDVPDGFQILNGEIGVVTDILPDGSFTIDTLDRLVHIPASYLDYIPRFNKYIERDPRKKFDLAYAVTTHKMQGSECDHVCYVMHRTISGATNRNNLYTAVTRARKGVHLITDGVSMGSVPRRTAQAQQAARYKAKHAGWSIEA